MHHDIEKAVMVKFIVTSSFDYLKTKTVKTGLHQIIIFETDGFF